MGAESLAGLLGISKDAQSTLVHVKFSRGDALTIKGQQGLSNFNNSSKMVLAVKS